MLFNISSFLEENPIINDIKIKNPPIGNAEGIKNTPIKKSLCPSSNEDLNEKKLISLLLFIRDKC